MRLLLDTHIWIWSHAEAHKLSSEVARELTNPQNERYLSAVSVWETILLLEKKRIRSKGDFLDWFKRSKLALGLIEVPLNWEIAREIRYTTLGYRNSRDSFLVVTTVMNYTVSFATTKRSAGSRYPRVVYCIKTAIESFN